MKKLLLFLLLANLALFAYGYADRINSQSQASADRYKPFNAEKIKSLTAQQVSMFGPAKVAQLTLACAEWGPLTEAERVKAAQLLEPLALGRTLTWRRVDVSAQHWVYIPPKPNRGTADRSMADLKKLNVTGATLVLEAGQWNFAISLGAFLTKSAADTRLAELRAKGVKTATYRQREQTVIMAAMVLREPTQAMLTKLEELRAQVAGSNISTGACPEQKT
jgi:hypothetical protein